VHYISLRFAFLPERAREAPFRQVGPCNLYNVLMNPWRSDGRRDLWLPVLVGLLGTLASLAAWGFMVADRREQILGAAHETADGTRESAEVALRRQVEALRDVRDLWRAIDAPSGDAPPTDLSEWIERAAGLTSLEVERMDVDGAAGAAREGLSREQAETLLAGAEVIVGPTDAPDGAVVYAVIVPLERPDGATGLLVARFDVASFLEEVLAARAHGYALIVGWQGREIYRRGVSSADRWQGWWKSEATVSLPLGGTWDFVLRPTPDFAALRLTPIPHYFLATGLVLSPRQARRNGLSCHAGVAASASPLASAAASRMDTRGGAPVDRGRQAGVANARCPPRAIEGVVPADRRLR